MNRARALAVLALIASGCVPDTKKLDPLRDAASACPVLFDLVTAKLAECQGLAPYLKDRFYAGALPGCGVIAAGEKAGRIGYDRAAAESCFSALDAPGCDAFASSACDVSPFVPKVGVNGFCVNNVECTSASDGCYSPTLACGAAKCLAAGTVGAPCGTSVTSSCDAHTFCDTSTYTCQARAGNGAACLVPCDAGLYCPAAVCVPQLSAGSPCTGYGQCSEAQNLYCSGGGTCQPIPATPHGVGQECGYPLECASNLWCDYATSPYTCKAKVQVPSACTSDSECGTPGSACIADTVGGPTSHCRVLLGEGLACTPGLGACQYGLYCKPGTGASGTCTRWPGLSGTCGTINGEYVPCGEGWCDRPGSPTPPTGTCMATLPPGSACPTSSECGSEGFGFTRSRCMTVTPGTAPVCVAPCAAP